ncbi:MULTISPECIES: DUF3156 family protein [Pseudomonas]|uniref:DUF3156 family protein n=1 Tax=Pseudomonas fulva TaxID=47880 RepID=A0A0D0KN51_9PSED|nr:MULTISPECIES: DUF3156 family protein [Pseudomonas]KIP98398.1 hypothetical protein RU08_15385 [Pseudomonas fulva]
MLRRLSDFFARASSPSGYRPGVTLEHVRRNLAGLGFEKLDGTRGRFDVPDAGLQFEAHERTHSELLMHLVLTDFVLSVPSCKTEQARLELRHSGAIRRAGIVAQRRVGDVQAVEAAMLADEALMGALMPLDFKRLQIVRSDGSWHVSLEHMAASEVVNRMPSFRRYIRLDDRQRGALIAALSHLQRILRRH